MRIDEAIRILALERDDWETSHCTPMKRKEAFEMAINALTKEAWKEEHPVSPLLDLQPCNQDDLISRAAAQPETHEKRTETHSCDYIERQAVEHLDWFTKLYCRDKSITDDLAFRCEQCEFEMPDDRCLVKVMARKLCPDYKDFGAMGDL